MKRTRNENPPPTHCCYICGRLITGDHVYIKTKRGSELHIHFECMRGGGKDE